MECELCGEDCFITGCLEKEHKMKHNYWNLQKLKKEYKEAYQSMKSSDTDDDTYYAMGYKLEGLAHDIQMIEENIPRPPKPGGYRPTNILGHRLDPKGRRVKLPNGKYAR